MDGSEPTTRNFSVLDSKSPFLIFSVWSSVNLKLYRMEEVELQDASLCQFNKRNNLDRIEDDEDHDDDNSNDSSTNTTRDNEVIPLTLPPFSQSLGPPILFQSMTEQKLSSNNSSWQKYRYLLGRKYRRSRSIEFLSGFNDNDDACSIEEEEEINDDGRIYEKSLFWFTYRSNFPEIHPYGYTSDAGWGCMLRASQMLVAHALRVHFKGRDWLPPNDFNSRRIRGSFYHELLTWFADFPGVDCCYSFHNMVACGLSFEKFPGEWYGPGTACHVMRQLCDVHKSYLRRRIDNGSYRGSIDYDGFQSEMFEVVVTSEGCIFKDAIEKSMCSTKSNEESHNETKFDQMEDLFNDPLLRPPPVKAKFEWKSSLLLLVPLRLGLNKFNDNYVSPLIETFSLPQSVGIIGGRPSHAIWFYGIEDDGSKLYGLDPHTVQQSPRRDPRLYGAVSVSDSYIKSVHTKKPTTMNINKLDPSLAMAFYCKSRSEFKLLLESLHRINKKTPLISIVDVAPDYTSDLNFLNEMMGTTELEEANDEDEYIFL